VPVIGARTRRQLAESLAALEVKLSAAEIARLEEICNPQSIHGTRYGADQMQMLDSER
jgi:aryl-alcohol dehydrogenase-like predicted oxidoreductase